MGGGGLTVVGWMQRNDLDRIKGQATPTFPIDASSVGLIEELPAPVRIRVERVTISASHVLQIKQFHPTTAPITLSTTSRAKLVVCPDRGGVEHRQRRGTSRACAEFDHPVL